MSVLDGLPRPSTRKREWRRLGLFLVGALLGVFLPLGFHFGAGPVSLLLVTLFAMAALVALDRQRVRRDLRCATLVADAESTWLADPERALMQSREALSLGTTDSSTELRAWLVVARAAEARGAFADASEAIGCGLASGGNRDLVMFARALRAFFDACRGALDDAEAGLLRVPLHPVSVETATERMRARTMLFYRQGRFRETVDTVTEALGKGLGRRERDAAFFEAMMQSARLRLDVAATGGHPMRVAAAPELEAWLDVIEPELAAAKAMRR